MVVRCGAVGCAVGGAVGGTLWVVMSVVMWMVLWVVMSGDVSNLLLMLYPVNKARTDTWQRLRGIVSELYWLTAAVSHMYIGANNASYLCSSR